MVRVLVFFALLGIAFGGYTTLSTEYRPSGQDPVQPGRVLVSDIIPGRFLAPAPRPVDDDPLALFNAEDTILIIFNHGSINEKAPDACDPDGMAPGILADLSGQELSGLRIAVFAYCSHLKVGVENPQDFRGYGLSIDRRAEDIEDLIRSFIESGMPAEQIFLSGQSEGAWASLLAARRERVPFNGVIAFAPAFAGQHEERSARWWQVHNAQADVLGAASHLNGLVFAFEGDPFNGIDDLAFLAAIEGIDFVPLSGESIDGLDCWGHEPHFTAYRNCFRRTQKSVILDFIKHRLWQAHVTN